MNPNQGHYGQQQFVPYPQMNFPGQPGQNGMNMNVGGGGGQQSHPQASGGLMGYNPNNINVNPNQNPSPNPNNPQGQNPQGQQQYSQSQMAALLAYRRMQMQTQQNQQQQGQGQGQGMPGNMGNMGGAGGTGNMPGGGQIDPAMLMALMQRNQQNQQNQQMQNQAQSQGSPGQMQSQGQGGHGGQHFNQQQQQQIQGFQGGTPNMMNRAAPGLTGYNPSPNPNAGAGNMNQLMTNQNNMNIGGMNMGGAGGIGMNMNIGGMNAGLGMERPGSAASHRSQTAGPVGNPVGPGQMGQQQQQQQQGMPGGAMGYGQLQGQGSGAMQHPSNMAQAQAQGLQQPQFANQQQMMNANANAVNPSPLLGKRKNVANGPEAMGSPGSMRQVKRQNTSVDGGMGGGPGTQNGMGMGPGPGQGQVQGGHPGFQQHQGQQQQMPNAGPGQPQQQNPSPNQGGPGAGPSNQPQPPPNFAGFPFAPQILPYVSALQNPQAAQALQQQQPEMFIAAQKAANILRSGEVTQEVLQQMQAFLYQHKQQAQAAQAAQQAQQARQAAQQGQQPQQHQQQPQQGQPGPSQPGQMPQSTAPTPTSAAPRSAVGGKSVPNGNDKANGAKAAKPPVKEKKASKEKKPRKPTKKDTKEGTEPPTPVTKAPPPMPPTPAQPVAGPSQLNRLPPPAPAVPAPPPQPELPPPPVIEPPPLHLWDKYRHVKVPIMKLEHLPNEINDWEDPTYGGRLPVLSEREKKNIRQWVDKDVEYGAVVDDHRAAMDARMTKWKATQTPRWWEHDRRLPRGLHPSGLDLIWPVDKAKKRENVRMHKRKMAHRFSRAELRAPAEVQERLIPIRIDLEHGETRFQDTFIWNAADPTVKPSMFAAIVCQDFELPPEHFENRIAQAIEEKVREADAAIALGTSDMPPSKAGLQEDELEWWGKVREEIEKRFEDDAEVLGEPIEPGLEEGLDQAPLDLRVNIQLDIISGTMHLTDCFEWDLQSEVTPEQFADVYAADLGLNGEFKTAIAHDIREQVQIYQKSLTLIGYAFDGSLITDPDLAADFLPPLNEVVRVNEAIISTHTPFLTPVTEMDLLNFDRDRERKDVTKRKRGTRGRRLVALPDRDPQKTNRTRVTGLDETGKPFTLAAAPKIPLPTRPTPNKAKPAPRRAAAVAARTNMAAMANDLDGDNYPTIQSPQVISHALPTRSRRNRVITASPQPESPAPIPPVSQQAEVKQEAEAPGAAAVDVDKEEDVPPPTPASSWQCSHCNRPERVLQDKRKFEGPPEKPVLCAGCAPIFGKAPAKSKEPTPPPFQDIASPDSTLSSDADESRSNAAPNPRSSQPVPTPAPPTPAVGASSASGNNISPPSGGKESLPTPVTPSANRSVSASGSHKPTTPVEVPPAPAWVADILKSAKKHKADVRAVYRPNNSEENRWKIKCRDCPGMVYSATQRNLEIHLKNRQHVLNLTKRLGTAPPTPA